MNTEKLTPFVRTAVEDVFETAFYLTCCTEENEPTPFPDSIHEVTIGFQIGNFQGKFALAFSWNLAKTVTANFLGLLENDLNAEQINDMICETANMCCGDFLKRIQGYPGFHIEIPIGPEQKPFYQTSADIMMMNGPEGYLHIRLEAVN